MLAIHAIILFIAGAVLLAQAYTNEFLLSLIVALFSAVVLLAGRWRNLKRYLVATLAGGICENLAVAVGGWGYANATLFAPLWLPLGWGFSVITLEEAFGKEAKARFSYDALILAVLGTLSAALLAEWELLVLAMFFIATFGLFAIRFYDWGELRMGVFAALLGTGMEAISIWAGNWEYSAAMFAGVPLWLPLCWFNAFLIMRRVMRAFDGEKREWVGLRLIKEAFGRG